MDRIITLLMALCVSAAMGVGGQWFADHHGPLGFHVQVLMWRPGFDLPDSLATIADKRLAAEKLAEASLATQTANVTSLRAALDAQNSAVEALRADSDLRVAQSVKATLAARAVAASWQSQAQAILAAKADGADACVSADHLIRSAFQ